MNETGYCPLCNTSGAHSCWHRSLVAALEAKAVPMQAGHVLSYEEVGDLLTRTTSERDEARADLARVTAERDVAVRTQHANAKALSPLVFDLEHINTKNALGRALAERDAMAKVVEAVRNADGRLPFEVRDALAALDAKRGSP